MSILIPGMEMPTSCGQCLNIGWHYVFECRLDDVEEGERLPNCPLVELPPHGRLIDADKLNKKPKKCFRVQDGAFPKSEWFIRASDLFDAPTVIPAEEGEG